MDMIGRIRRLHSRGKKSEREIARLTGLSCNTVAKWLKASLEPVPKYQRKAMSTKLEPFHEVLKQARRADARRLADGGARPRRCTARSSRPATTAATRG